MKQKFRFSLFWKIFLGNILILTLILGVLSNIITINYSKFIENKTIQYNTEVLSFIMQSIDKYSIKLEQIVYSIYKPNAFESLFNTTGMENSTYEKIKRQIEVEQLVRQNINFNSMQQDILNTLIYKDDESFFFIGNGGIKNDLKISELDWYRQFVDSNQDTFVFGPCTEDYLQFPDPNGEKVILYIKRLYPALYQGELGKPSFMMISIRFKTVEQLFQQLLISEKSGMAIINLNDELVFTRNVNDKIKSMLEREANLLFYPNVSNKSPGDKDGVILTSYFIKGFNWRIISVNYKDEMLSEVDQIIHKFYFMIVSAGLAALILSMLISYQIINPLRNMNYVIKKVEQGNFEVHVDVKSRDEVGQLGKSFNIMVFKIKELIEKVFMAELKEKEARIEALHAQINPHFLFNTLENINAIAQVENVEIISDLTKSLSSMLRYSIQSGMNHTILALELEHVRNYMHIIDVRFDGKIKYKEDIDPELMDCLSIKLMLQPLVENAVQHGISKRLSCEGNIYVKGTVTDGFAQLSIEDDGVGMGSEKLRILQDVLQGQEEAMEQFKPSRLGIGLKNVQDRLRLLFGADWGMTLDSREGTGTIFTIRFPIQKNYTQYPKK